MDIIKSLISSGFHDTSLVGASQHADTITLDIEYRDDDDFEHLIKVIISKVEYIYRDSVRISEFMMETTHASIINLSQNESDIIFVLDWVDFQTHNWTTCCYKIQGAEVRLSTEHD